MYKSFVYVIHTNSVKLAVYFSADHGRLIVDTLHCDFIHTRFCCFCLACKFTIRLCKFTLYEIIVEESGMSMNKMATQCPQSVQKYRASSMVFTKY